jgi:hypothetical protein
VLVREANPDRNVANVHRRTLKLIEELGEVAQAWLNVTSASNGKHKTWHDVREEIADCLIVALDIGWTILRNEIDVPDFQFHIYPRSPAFDEQMIFDAIWYLGKFGRDFVRSHITQVIHQVMIMALCVLPDQLDSSIETIEAQLLVEVQRKLAKWAQNRGTMAVVTDDV